MATLRIEPFNHSKQFSHLPPFIKWRYDAVHTNLGRRRIEDRTLLNGGFIFRNIDDYKGMSTPPGSSLWGNPCNEDMAIVMWRRELLNKTRHLWVKTPTSPVIIHQLINHYFGSDSGIIKNDSYDLSSYYRVLLHVCPYPNLCIQEDGTGWIPLAEAIKRMILAQLPNRHNWLCFTEADFIATGWPRETTVPPQPEGEDTVALNPDLPPQAEEEVIIATEDDDAFDPNDPEDDGPDGGGDPEDWDIPDAPVVLQYPWIAANRPTTTTAGGY